ncbi:MAG: ABC transporter permease [Bacteroidia bacterium]|nr:ABC transporter permease [Bacteroidia bacterium]
MIKNYFKIAWRNMFRNRQYNLLSILGLSVAVAAVSLLFVVLNFETSFDRFHPDASRIYRVITKQVNGNGNINYTTGSPLPVAARLDADLPQLEVIAPVYGANEPTVAVLENDSSSTTQKKFIENDKGIFVTPAFFELFPFSWKEGTPAVLDKPYSVVISDRYARKYFDNPEKAIGRFLKIDNQVTFEVTGILNNPPLNTDFPMDLVFSYATKKANPLLFGYATFDNWNSTSSSDQLFVKLAKGVTEEQANKQLLSFSEKVYKKTGTGGRSLNLLSSLSNMHTDEQLDKFNPHYASTKRLATLRLIGILILLMACINFINITTALSGRRSKEVGIRKVLGGKKQQLIGQFLLETFCMVCFALFAGVVIAKLLLPFSNRLFQLPEDVGLLSSTYIKFMLVLPFIITLFSGLYPAFILSSFKPVQSFRRILPGSWLHIFSLRKSLIVVQFSVALILVVTTVVNLQQLSYIRTMDMGFKKEGIYTFKLEPTLANRDNHLRDELLQAGYFTDVSFAMDPPSSMNKWGSNFSFDHRAKDEAFETSIKVADGNYFNCYGMEFLAGQPYNVSDSITRYVVNETFLKKLGIKQPDEVIGKEIFLGDKWHPICGVVKDFQTATARDKIRPLVFFHKPDMYWSGAVKIKSASLVAAVRDFEKYYNKVFPETVADGRFYEDDLNEYYKNEHQLSQLSWIFSALSIFIACIGLFGLSAFSTEQRTKEIGIRKVLGASTSGITLLLSKDFLKLVILSIVVATPVSFYIMTKWLQQFEYRIKINWWVFAVAGIMGLIIAFATLSLQTVKAAWRNPVKSLRTE